MTDDETFTAICADFPFDRVRLEGLHARLDALFMAPRGASDGTIDAVGRKRLQHLVWAMSDLIAAIKCIEEDGDPGEFIPF